MIWRIDNVTLEQFGYACLLVACLLGALAYYFWRKGR